jgi:hypothetical protein
MARVTYGAAITELQGSIGGITFQRNASGSIARLRPKKPLVSNARQIARQVPLSQLLGIWQSLTQGDIDDWNDLAAAHDHVNAWGETKTLSGFQWFMSYNLNLHTIGAAYVDTPAAYAAPTQPNPITCTATDAQFRASFGAAQATGGDKVLLYASPPIQQFSLKNRRLNRLLGVVNGGSITYFDLMDLYEAVFNLDWEDFFYTANATIIVRIRFQKGSSGYLSHFTEGSIKFPYS